MTCSVWSYQDILEISELEKKCFTAPWSYKMLADTFMAGNFRGIIVRDNDRVIGYGGFVYGGGEADVTTVGVAEDCRNRGTGSLIMNELFKQAEILGVCQINLEVRPSNLAAIALYIKCGFKKIYIRKKYYADGEDAIIMQKSLIQG